jgi:hypothetical protein
MKTFTIIIIFSLFQCILSVCLLKEERRMNLYYDQTFTVDSPSYNAYALQFEVVSTTNIPIIVRTPIDKMHINLTECYPWEPIIRGGRVSIDFYCPQSICLFVYSFTITHVYSMTPFGLMRRGMVALSIISFFIILVAVICLTVFVVLRLKKRFVIDHV